MDRPRLFIGSSTEGLRIAEILFGHMEASCRAYLWKHGLFRPGMYPIEALQEELGRTDFAVIVGTPDDELTKRGETNKSIRDNLLFELGLFMGKLGRRRAYLLVPNGVDLTLPSDLGGLTTLRYDAERFQSGDPRDKIAAVQVAATEVRNAIEVVWGQQQAQLVERNRKLQAGQRLQAVKRLHGVIVQLKDLLVVLPGDAIGSLGNRTAFAAVKESASERVQRLYTSWEADARLIGVRAEFEALTRATQAAALEFPYPDELLVTDIELKQRALALGGEAVQAFLAGGNPVRTATEAATSEVEQRMLAVQRKYSQWWTKHSTAIQRSTGALQEALVTSATSVGLEAIE